MPFVLRTGTGPAPASRLVLTLLWELWVLIEIGLALLEEGPSSLLRLVESVIKHGRVARQFLYSGLSVKLGVESGLESQDSAT